MNLKGFRLFLTLTLFAGWLGYLGFQVATRPQRADHSPLVVSRPQILASEIDVVADVPDTSGKATVVEVLYPENADLKPGDTIQVGNIGECYSLPRPDAPAPSPDWQGAGKYLLPLRQLPGKKKYEVVAIPPSPGFFLLNTLSPPPRLYPDSPQTRAQYHQIAKPQAN